MKFNNRIIRKILIRDNRPESSIVSLYKKLELQNAMEILDQMSGDISADPSLLSLQYVSLLVLSSSSQKSLKLSDTFLSWIYATVISVKVCGQSSITMICFLLISVCLLL